MRLSENRLVIMNRKKFTSPPSQKAIKGHKIGKVDDLTLINTVIYKV